MTDNRTWDRLRYEAPSCQTTSTESLADGNWWASENVWVPCSLQRTHWVHQEEGAR